MFSNDNDKFHFVLLLQLGPSYAIKLTPRDHIKV